MFLRIRVRLGFGCLALGNFGSSEDLDDSTFAYAWNADPGVQELWKKIPLGGVDTRVRFGIWERPHYAYGVYSAAQLAKHLRSPGVTVIEFGVAGGNGLLALERCSREVSAAMSLPISVVGFDTGRGMPEPGDFRDLPHVWAKGFYAMDVGALRARFRQAQLIIGNVANTAPQFLAGGIEFPIGFIAFDLDYYSSTIQAFVVFDGPPETRLPRVFCYFDDIMWPEYACHNEHVGELAAIREFNSKSDSKQICPLHLLRNMRPHPEPWNDQFYVFHDFVHPNYCTNITAGGSRFQQKPLASASR